MGPNAVLSWALNINRAFSESDFGVEVFLVGPLEAQAMFAYAVSPLLAKSKRNTLLCRGLQYRYVHWRCLKPVTA